MLKPQDVLVALQLALVEARRRRAIPNSAYLQSGHLDLLAQNATVRILAEAVGIGAGEWSRAMARLRACHLALPEGERLIVLSSLEEFVLHGLRYVFPAEIGTAGVGLQTAWAGPNWRPLPAAKQVYGDDRERPVMAWSGEGVSRGLLVAPLYPTAPRMAAQCPVMYAAIARIDSLRIGAARERKVASEELAAFFAALRAPDIAE